jgi:two-component system, chemotaxis family, chemotaxis protein CheY
MRALVVDDSKAIRVVLKKMLTEGGFEDLSEAAHGAEAMEVLANGPAPDVILVDWNMPEMNGLEMIRAVRSNPELRRIPIVMVTTETEYSQVVKALAAGASEYVMKPFTKDIIMDKLDMLGVAPEGV